LIEFGFEKGAVFNLPDGRVEVLLGGPKEKIKEFHNIVLENFIHWAKAKAKDHEALKKQIGNPGIRFSELDFNEDLLVHKLATYGHSLTFDQIYKGVDIYKNLVAGYNKQINVQQELTQAIKELRESLEKNQ
ncbi:MAG: acylphosphatase, partial [Candidatus Hydrothermarchaeales archaeon]